MAKLLNQYNAEIVNGSKVESSHIKQFADAFTGEEAYDIEISGSLTVNGIEVKSGQLSSGTNYITVLGTGTPEENAAELQAAYNEAKKMPRFIGVKSTPTQMYAGQTFGTYTGSYAYYKVLVDGTYNPLSMESSLRVVVTESEAKSTHTTVIVAPGEYNFGTTAFMVYAPGINIVSLTGNSDVIINSTENYSTYNTIYGIKVTANDILIKGINCKTNAFYIESNLNNLICEYCKGGNYSFGAGKTVSGTFKNCTGGDVSFAGSDSGIASGTFTNCTGGGASFGGNGGTASGIFNNCVGGGASFAGGGGGIALGTFTNCTGGNLAFGGGTASGIFTNCIGGNNSFGLNSSTVSGTFNYCIGGNNSFGGTSGTIETSARLYYTRLTSGTFKTPVAGGRLILCIDGGNNIVTI